MQALVNIHRIFLYKVACGIKIALALYSLYFGELAGENLSQGLIIVDST